MTTTIDGQLKTVCIDTGGVGKDEINEIKFNINAVGVKLCHIAASR